MSELLQGTVLDPIPSTDPRRNGGIKDPNDLGECVKKDCNGRIRRVVTTITDPTTHRAHLQSTQQCSNENCDGMIPRCAKHDLLPDSGPQAA